MLLEARALLAEEETRIAMPLIEAADFVSGGRADFGRAIGKHGVTLELVRRNPGEGYVDFLCRVEASAVAQDAGLAVIGGIDPCFDSEASPPPGGPAPIGAVTVLEGPLHLAQRRALRLILDNRRAILRAGRRLGKTVLCTAIAADEAIRGRLTAYVCPQYKLARPVFEALVAALRPIITTKDRTQGVLELRNGGAIDVWTIESGAVIARGRRYHRIVVDEAAHVLDSTNMPLIWSSALAPTLLDFKGDAIAASTPFGISPANWFYQIANSPALDWREYHAPTSENPFIDAAELEDIKKRSHPLIFRQEYLAEFTSLDGAALFNLANLLQENGEPWPEPGFFDLFYIAIDTAMKTGSANDGTAVVYVGMTETHEDPGILWLLDWDVLQVGAGKIEPWFEMVWQRCREITNNPFGKFRVIGPCYVEDAAAGSILVERFEDRVTALPKTWLQRGKDLRALAIEQYMNSGRVRITEHAYRKTVLFKELEMNHLWAQLSGFVMGDPQASKRSDDLLDACVYCASVACLEQPVE
jgi:hypothetical protein